MEMQKKASNGLRENTDKQHNWKRNTKNVEKLSKLFLKKKTIQPD